MPDWEIDKELELDTIYSKQQLFDPSKQEPDIWINQDHRNNIHPDFDLYDSLFATGSKKDSEHQPQVEPKKAEQV